MRTLLWFRGKDLRVADHAPLVEAAAGGEVVPVFVLDPYFFAPDRARELPHRMQFLLDSLRSLEANLAHLGSRLLVVEGRSTEVIPQLADQWKVDRVFAHGWTEPFARERDRRVEAGLGRAGIPFRLFEGVTLAPPGSLLTGGGTMYGVFTPFARAFRQRIAVSAPLPAPRSLPPLPTGPTPPTVPIPQLGALGLARNDRLQAGGEKAGRERLRRFLAGPLDGYAEGRNRLDVEGSSRLSADLKFGTLSVRGVWHAAASSGQPAPSVDAYLIELLWREFSHHLLWHRPGLLEGPFRADFQGFPWAGEGAGFEAWAQGRTGYPLVDAAARQLRETGFVHNRARMIAASFLTKHLMVDYRLGEAHYLTWLTDGDWAPNNAGWQWSAGCGCDAQPWFRVFNPVTQGGTFDPEGAYVRRFLPELVDLDPKWIHRPWEAPESQRRKLDYPEPIVDHAKARIRFLEAAKRHLKA
ncbi:MAG TPA: deoxyribodipyrimidine photo-lyase [Holophagaceae bacterium]|nr:deoxyribodipyrimidine photo-lyase [Holophagaceae bacterium]